MVYVVFVFTDPDGNIETLGMTPAKDEGDESVLKLIREQMTEDQVRRGCRPKYICGSEPNFISDIKKHAIVPFGESLDDCKSYDEPLESLACRRRSINHATNIANNTKDISNNI